MLLFLVLPLDWFIKYLHLSILFRSHFVVMGNKFSDSLNISFILSFTHFSSSLVRLRRHSIISACPLCQWWMLLLMYSAPRFTISISLIHRLSFGILFVVGFDTHHFMMHLLQFFSVYTLDCCQQATVLDLSNCHCKIRQSLEESGCA